ncbi:MAG: DUF1579 domain-containing protein [Phycisphaerae bacterium]|nr:DUF1579 domain-containing protein [Phycisphaerae bacterium]
MRLRRLLQVVALVGAMVLAADAVVSQGKDAPGKPKPSKADKPQAKPDSEALVDMWVRHAMPGEHHKLLRKMAGSWDMAIKYRMTAGDAAVESKGVAERKWILGNRFLLEEFDGGNLALPFQGLAIYGYDAFEQKYTSVWVDTTSTSITTNLGTCRDDCKVITFVGQHGDPWTGIKKRSRGVTRLIDENQHVLELYEPGSDGKEFKVLEIVYTRRMEN